LLKEKGERRNVDFPKASGGEERKNADWAWWGNQKIDAKIFGRAQQRLGVLPVSLQAVPPSKVPVQILFIFQQLHTIQNAY